MESQRHDLKCDQMEDKGDHRVKDRKTHFVDSLKDRVRHRRDGVKYDRKRTVDRHPDRQSIISRENSRLFTGPASTVSPTVDGIATKQEKRIADATRSHKLLSPIATALDTDGIRRTKGHWKSPSAH